MPVPPKNLFIVEQASCLLLKKLVENTAKYQIKHSYSLFLLACCYGSQTVHAPHLHAGNHSQKFASISLGGPTGV
ncbi:hypothetical protein QUB28_06035 [Microcoleus sp. B4-C3]|uniref:hypothetical protein n=1 Tax=Microcoleus sp. B4-C2 TaxID=2818661 RepID=UPI002FD5D62C